MFVRTVSWLHGNGQVLQTLCHPSGMLHTLGECATIEGRGEVSMSPNVPKVGDHRKLGADRVPSVPSEPGANATIRGKQETLLR